MLSFAAASGRIGYVCFEDDQLIDWGLSVKASTSPTNAAAYARKPITLLAPDVVVTEKVTNTSRKGAATHALIEALAAEAADHELHDVSVVRQQHYPNKYIEAAAYAERFPEIRSRLPKQPRIWEGEPRNTIYFEAIALALHVLSRDDL